MPSGLKEYTARLAKLGSHYWPLIKSRQTGLLLLTGLTGYLSTRCPVFHLDTVIALTISLFLTISGSTMINMWYDRDIDAIMPRTCQRPLPSGRVRPRSVILLGITLTLAGLLIAFWMDLLYGSIVLLGVVFDVVVYTAWLKRRTAWAIILGGISGGMPGLAGRALGLGFVDWVGIALALGILFWIPTHIMTISIKYEDEYRKARIPTFPSTYGLTCTHRVIASANIFATLALAAVAFGVGMSWGFFRLIMILSVSLLALALAGVIRPSQKRNFQLFKFASVYLTIVMVLVSFAAL